MTWFFHLYGFICLMVGACVGALAVALCVVASRKNNDNDKGGRHAHIHHQDQNG